MKIVIEQIKKSYSNLQLLILIGCRHEIWGFYDCDRKNNFLQKNSVHTSTFRKSFPTLSSGFCKYEDTTFSTHILVSVIQILKQTWARVAD